MQNTTTINQEILLSIFLLGRKVRKKMRNEDATKMLNHAILVMVASSKHNISSLANSLSVSISTMSEKIGNLQKDGLVLLKQDNDKRHNIVKLTQKGKDLLLSIKQRFESRSERMLANITNEEKTTFLHVIQTIHSNLEKEMKE